MKSFNDIYHEVLKSSKNELENLRKKMIIRILITIVFEIIILVLGMKNNNVVFINIGLLVAILFCIVLMIGPKKSYKKVYKEKVVKKFIKEYDENLDFYYNQGIDSYTYRMGEFENFDRYHSEDLIKGKIDGHHIIMAEVHTEKKSETTDKDGHKTTTYTTLFHGLFGEIQLNNSFNGTVKIHSDKGFFGKLFQGKKRIEMDSEEFEKYFEVLADDKIQAMQVLTSDIMDNMISFIKETKIKYELTIKSNKIYIRFKTGGVFEANVFKSSVDFDTLKKVYDIINFTFNITRKFIKVIEETEL